MARVVRCRLKTPEERLTFWREKGPFRYAVLGAYNEEVYANLLLCSDEWIFADDLMTLSKALLQWDARQLHAEWVTPTEEDYNDPIFGNSVIATWDILHLPEALDDFTLGITSDLPILCDPSVTPAEVEAAFLDWFVKNLSMLDDVLFFDFAEESFEAWVTEGEDEDWFEIPDEERET